MQATLDATGLKHLTRALVCLSKFGEYVVLSATPEALSLSATNTSISAFGRFKYARSFFSRYRVDTQMAAGDDEEAGSIMGQINLKPLISVLKHKTNEKGCEKCELVITDGPSQNARLEDEDEEQHDTLESRLTVRLHCKHGVVKTHRLALNQPNSLVPNMSEQALESRLVVGPKALKNLLDHFPFSRGSKSDPQLIWNFWDEEVQLRSWEPSGDTKDKVQLSTELVISAEEFDQYDLQTGSMTIAFHLKEFYSVIAMAEASQTPLEIRFSDPAEPVFISIDSDLYDTLFLIAASYVQSSQKSSQKPSQARANGNSNMKGKKRPLEDDNSNRNGNVRVVERNREEKRKPMKVAQRVDREPVRREMRPPPVPSPQQAPQPSWAILTAAQQQQQHTNHDYDQEQYDDYRNDQDHYESAGPSQPEVGRGRAAGTGKGKGKEPLFLPSSQLSQLPPAAEAAIIESGLGIENMTAEEFEAMLEGDAEEVEFGEARLKAAPSGADEEDELEDEFQVGGQQWRVEDLDFGQGESGESRDSFELVDDVEMEPTQNGGGFKPFRPLFED